jgi:hypothetical protein
LIILLFNNKYWNITNLLLFNKIIKHFDGNIKGKTFAMWGLSFKPKTDDMREAPSRTVISGLLRAGARVQVHIPLPVVKPFARIGGGWAWLGSLNPASALWTCSPGSTGNDCPSISGWNLNAGAGVDFAVRRWLTLGAGLDFYLLNLNRAASPTQVNFMRTGDSMGFQLALSAQAAFRF